MADGRDGEMCMTQHTDETKLNVRMGEMLAKS